MGLKDYYTELKDKPVELQKKLAELCSVTENTAWRWLNGKLTPDPLKRKLISEYLNIPEDELFPEAKQK